MKTLLSLLLALFATLSSAADFDYALAPVEIARDVYALIGKTEDFDTRNGGNIVNTGFIVAPGGVIVIDTGPSLRYGRQMRAAIARITAKPVVAAINTHHHPDHFLGNQAYADVPIAALPAARQGIASDGNAFAENLFRMSGDWMAGTEVVVPTQSLGNGVRDIAGRRLRLLALEGHTGADLAIYDETSGVLFSGDLAFYRRAPTTPHAQIPRWLASLDTLEALTREAGFRTLVPGHGPITHDAAPIRQTRDWLNWLNSTLTQAAAEGLDMNDLLSRPLPPAFADLPVGVSEYRRSVGHLFPAIEQEALDHRH